MGKLNDKQGTPRGGVKYSLIVLGGVLALLIGTAAWFSWRYVAASAREKELEITVACAHCKHCFDVSYRGLLALVEESGRQGMEGAGTDPRSPIGVCPKCGKRTLYRAEKDRKTGEPVFPAFVTRK